MTIYEMSQIVSRPSPEDDATRVASRASPAEPVEGHQPLQGTVYQLNRKPYVHGERGIPKLSTPSVRILVSGVAGDHNQYRMEEKGGDLERALLLLPLETIEQLRTEGWPLVQPGDLGENITTSGIPYESFVAGDVYWVGDVPVELTKQGTPCYNLAVLPYVGDRDLKRFEKVLVGRRGWYAKVLHGGVVRKDDVIVKSQMKILRMKFLYD